MILINHESTPNRKERLCTTSKARREASQNELVEKGGVPGRVESFRKVDVARMIRGPSLGLLKNPKWTEKGTEL